MSKNKKFRESLHAEIDRQDAKKRADRTLILPKNFFTDVEKKNKGDKDSSTEHYTEIIRD